MQWNHKKREKLIHRCNFRPNDAIATVLISIWHANICTKECMNDIFFAFKIFKFHTQPQHNVWLPAVRTFAFALSHICYMPSFAVFLQVELTFKTNKTPAHNDKSSDSGSFHFSGLFQHGHSPLCIDGQWRWRWQLALLLLHLLSSGQQQIEQCN